MNTKVKLKHCFKIGWHPISVRQSNENCMARTVKIRNFFKIEWKLGLGEHVAIRLSCSTDAESFKIQTKSYQMTAPYNMVGQFTRLCYPV